MPAQYVIDKKRRLVITTVWNRLTYTEAKAHQDQLLGDPDFNSDFNQLIDASKVTRWDMLLEEAKSIASRNVFAPTSRRALLAKSPSLFGTGKLLEAYLQFAKGRAQVCVFYELASASQWLGLEQACDGEGHAGR